MKAYLEIEMPRCCNKCPLFVYEGIGICVCRALPAIEEGEILKPWKNRRKDCPLIPVPAHGRLIDADALMKGEGRYIISFGKEGIDVAEINRAPTIIPADKERI